MLKLRFQINFLIGFFSGQANKINFSSEYIIFRYQSTKFSENSLWINILQMFKILNENLASKTFPNYKSPWNFGSWTVQVGKHKRENLLKFFRIAGNSVFEWLCCDWLRWRHGDKNRPEDKMSIWKNQGQKHKRNLKVSHSKLIMNFKRIVISKC